MVVPFLGSGASLRSACGAWERCENPVTIANNPNACYLPENRCTGFDTARSPNDCLPQPAELSCYLARRTTFPHGETPDLTKVAQYYDSIAGGRSALNSELRSIFDRDYPFTSLHSMLAELAAPPLIVTTNYDDLIERAFRDKGRAYDVVIHTTDPAYGDKVLWLPHNASDPHELRQVMPNQLDIDLSKTPVIYKMHGAVDRSNRGRDQYVITEDDYIDFLTRMTRNRVIPAIFAQHFQSRHFLFMGYGLRDWNLRVVLNGIERAHEASRLVSWAIQHKPSLLERRFWSRRNVEVYDMKIEDFITKLP